VQETNRNNKWPEEDLSYETKEKAILLSWDLGPNSIHISNPTHPPSILGSTSWKIPPPYFLKINFDGTSKGNHGLTGFGIVFSYEHGNICNILVGSLGYDTDNSVEMWALIMGI
jgi:hypothetical protein